MSRRENRIRRHGPTAGWDLDRTRTEVGRIVDGLGDPKTSAVAPDVWLNRLRYATALALLMVGAGLMFGPAQWRSSQEFVVIYRYFPFRLRGLGAVLILEGLVHIYGLARHRFALVRIMFVLMAATTAAVATSFLAAALLGKLTEAFGPPMCAFFAMAAFVQAGRVRRNL